MPANYTLGGIASNFELGPGGPRFKDDGGGKIQARDPSDSALINVQGLTPAVDEDFATKLYVDNIAAGLSWQQPAKVRSSSNETIAAPGANIDGIAMTAGDRVLLTGQTTVTENGMWDWNGAAVPMTRPTSWATGTDVSGYAVFVQEGTSADKAYVATADPAVVDTNDPLEVEFASVVGGVTGATQLGTGIAVLANGVAPTLTFNSILTSAQIAVALASNDITLTIVAGSVGNPEMAANAIEEDNLAAGVAVLFRYLQLTFAGWPAVTGSNTVSVGTIMPANTVVTGGKCLVTTVFDNSATLEVGDAGDVDRVFESGDTLLSRADTYVSSRMSVLTASTQLLATRTTAAIAPTTGVAELIVELARVA